MFRDLRISNFRGFRNFQMDGLGRINLLVGPNNCGKSTVLEAILLLAAAPDPVVAGLFCAVRGGVVLGDTIKEQKNKRVAIRHLFHGRKIANNPELSIDSNGTSTNRSMKISISQVAKTSAINRQIALGYRKVVGEDIFDDTIILNSHAEWPMDDIRKRVERISLDEDDSVQYIDSGGVSVSTIIKELSSVSLNPDEQFVLDVLRILEPRIAGITAVAVSPEGSPSDRNGVYVKLTGEPERVPIASLGDGIWRLLGLALALVQARGSVLMVDEIDIGLHYTAQVDMWRMVKGAAEKLDVQVFATTHSSDCIRALASLARPDVTTGSDITIQRIEGERAVAYNEREIVLAAERGIEVR